MVCSEYRKSLYVTCLFCFVFPEDSILFSLFGQRNKINKQTNKSGGKILQFCHIYLQEVCWAMREFITGMKNLDVS